MIRTLVGVLCLVFSATAADLYNGQVYGIFQPLKTSETATSITITGGTFTYVVDKTTGQIVSAKALGDEFVAKGASFPNPYVGLMPEDDPGARREGGKDRPRYGYEKSVEMRPLLWSGDLTDAYRFDAAKGADIKTELVRSDPEFAEVRASGRYGNSPLSWHIDYLFDVDGFTKVTVELNTSKPVQLRWNCFNHAFLSKDAVQYLSRIGELGKPPLEPRPEPTVTIKGIEPDQPILESHWNPFFHLANRVTGIEFSKEDLSDRWSGYRDSSVILENGKTVDTGAVQTQDGRTLRSADSRGKVNMFTQLYMRQNALELEEFDIRNATFPFNPGDTRTRTFWVQLTPSKRPRNDLNSLRVVWPGPHQIVMTRWRGAQTEWEPPSDEQVKLWAQMGVNLIIGGADYWSGDWSRPLQPEKTRHFIETVHKYGMKVIPYVTFSDYNFTAPGYQEHAVEWMNSKSIEYANETTLMCFNAKGWRDHEEREWDKFLSEFPFDGLYIDCWINTRYCTNSRHGCNGYLGTFSTDGFHDFAKRARRVVARHTNGEGVMLLNANMLLFSGVVPWFDIRLNGENDDPLKMREETIATYWNGWGQGVQSLAMWRPQQDTRAMINLMTAFAIPFRLNRMQTPKDMEQWRTAKAPEMALARELWGLWRFFGVNGAEKFSSFDAGDVLSLSKPGSVVNGFARDGRALLVMGTVGDNAPREETLHVLAPDKLGLKDGVRYRILNLRQNRYLAPKTYTKAELAQIPVTLPGKDAEVLLIAPEKTGPQLTYYQGADDATARVSNGRMTINVKAVPGSIVTLHVDTAGKNFHPATPGFERVQAQGDFAVFEGAVPESGTVVLTAEAQR